MQYWSGDERYAKMPEEQRYKIVFCAAIIEYHYQTRYVTDRHVKFYWRTVSGDGRKNRKVYNFIRKEGLVSGEFTNPSMQEDALREFCKTLKVTAPKIAYHDPAEESSYYSRSHEIHSADQCYASTNTFTPLEIIYLFLHEDEYVITTSPLRNGEGHIRVCRKEDVDLVEKKVFDALLKRFVRTHPSDVFNAIFGSSITSLINSGDSLDSPSSGMDYMPSYEEGVPGTYKYLDPGFLNERVNDAKALVLQARKILEDLMAAREFARSLDPATFEEKALKVLPKYLLMRAPTDILSEDELRKKIAEHLLNRSGVDPAVYQDIDSPTTTTGTEDRA